MLSPRGIVALVAGRGSGVTAVIYVGL